MPFSGAQMLYFNGINGNLPVSKMQTGIISSQEAADGHKTTIVPGRSRPSIGSDSGADVAAKEADFRKE